MYPLLACSLVSLTVILERSLFWVREKRRAGDALVDEVLELVRLRKYQEIKAKTQGSADYVVRVLVCGLVHRGTKNGKKTKQWIRGPVRFSLK